mmetsp:Transcript_5254/g.14186  ORF Transcript_5254/g.14186 Transcript_5254/m.14186 type:complete len:245 (-) Transcript_5254:93-827(-)
MMDGMHQPTNFPTFERTMNALLILIALFGVMPRMAAIGLMLFLIFYIFAVMFTQLFKDLDVEDLEADYFSRIDKTFFTLFQIMTLDNWATIARSTNDQKRWAWLPFVAFVIISGFIVVNLIIAVICDAISALHRDAKARIHGTYDENSDSGSSSEDLEIREQLDCLEEQMEELTRIQAKTFHTLQYLSRQVQMQKLKQELSEKNPLQRHVANTTTTTTATTTAATATTTTTAVEATTTATGGDV